VNEIANIPLHVTPSSTLGEFMPLPFSDELKELHVICDVFTKKVGAREIPDHVGTFLALDERLRHILIVVYDFFYGGNGYGPQLLEFRLNSFYKNSLESSMSKVLQCLKEYASIQVKKT
jgi:hypothetical protein